MYDTPFVSIVRLHLINTSFMSSLGTNLWNKGVLIIPPQSPVGNPSIFIFKGMDRWEGMRDAVTVEVEEEDQRQSLALLIDYVWNHHHHPPLSPSLSLSLSLSMKTTTSPPHLPIAKNTIMHYWKVPFMKCLKPRLTITSTSPSILK